MGQNLVMNLHVDEALDHINQAEYSAHYMIIYPDLVTLRKLYSSYISKQLEENNETILINPFYETTDSVRQVLSGIDVSKYEKERVLQLLIL